ncbi:MAG: alpha/beta hydrolase [Synechococcales bacterium]|nr:alpha/beta hydrolase [Synechococcales bacterium]
MKTSAIAQGQAKQSTLEPWTGRPWWRWALHAGVWVGSITTVVGGFGALCGMRYVEHHLAPTVAHDLSRTLDRPVLLGEVTAIRPTGIRLGASAIPATATDADAIEVTAVTVGFSPLDVMDGAIGLVVTLEQPTLYLDQNAAGDWLETKLSPSSGDGVDISQIRLRNATVEMQPRGAARSVTLHDLSAVLRLNDPTQPLQFQVQGKTEQQGRFRVIGKLLDTGAIDAWIRIKSVAIAPLSPLLPPAVQMESGRVNGHIRILHEPDQPIALEGRARLENGSAWIKGEPNPFTHTAGQFRFAGQTIHIRRGQTLYGQIPFTVGGTIHLKEGLDLQARVRAVSVPDFMETFDLSLPVPAEGALGTDNLTVTGPFDEVVFAGTVYDARPVQIDQVALGSVRTEFTLNKRTDELKLFDTEFALASGGSIAGGAEIQLGDVDDAVIRLAVRQISADAIAQTYQIPISEPLGTVQADGRLVVTEAGLTAAGQWQLVGGTYPAQGQIQVGKDGLRLQETTVQWADGQVKVDGTIRDGDWTATLQTSPLPLQQFDPALTGTAQGQLTLSGRLDQLTPAGVQAAGDVRLTHLSADWPHPIAASVAWDGDRLQINRANSAGLSATGWIAPDWAAASPISAVDLTLQVPDYDLAALPLDLPAALSLTGRTQITARLTGTPDAPQVDGDLQVQDLAVNGAIAFDPDLSGSLHLHPDRGLALKLAGERDQIDLAIATPDHVKFDLQRDRARLEGTLSGTQLTATVAHLPLALIAQSLDSRLTAALTPGHWGGVLSARLTADLAAADNPRVQAAIAIDQPRLGLLHPTLAERHQGDRLVADIRYGDGQIQLQRGAVRFGESHLHLTGAVPLHRWEDASGQVDIPRAQLQDVLTALQWLPADGPTPVPVQAFVSPNPAPEDVELPWVPLSQSVRGELTGTIQRSPQTASPHALTTFDLQGQDWRWGGYGIDRVELASGQFDGTHLSVPLLRLAGAVYEGPGKGWRSPDAALTLALDSAARTGALRVTDIPLALLGQMMALSDVGGKLHLQATWQGDWPDPQLAGNLTLQNPSLGRLATPRMTVGFGYQGEHLRVGQWSDGGTVRELLAVGRIRLPWRAPLPAFVEPATVVAALPTASQPQALIEPQVGGRGAEQVIFHHGLIQPSFAVADLHDFVATGDVPDGWQLYLAIANLEPDALHALLTQEVTVNLGIADHLLNSAMGEQLLAYVGQVIHTPSQQANVQALRSALVMAAQDDARLSVLEVLDHYPHSEVHIDISQLVSLIKAMEAASP